MNDEHKREAARLQDVLKQQGVDRHDPKLRPFVEVADALTKDADTPVPPRDPNTIKNQRISLMNMANASTPTKTAAPAPTPSPAPAPTPSRRFPLWIGGAVAALAVVVLVVVSVKGPMTSLYAPTMSEVVARLTIPEAHAGDAFMLIAESQDATGAAVDTTFKVTSKVDVSASELQQHLKIVPPTTVTVDDLGNNEFRVTPAKALAPGEVYRLAVDTAVKKDDGSMTDRQFSWAVQTKDIFRVLSSVPGNHSSAVPLDTGIEVTMSQTGWEDPAAVFSISPNVAGKFVTHGRSLAFVPAKPLAPATLYTVTYKKGWKVTGSDLALTEDKVIAFETASTATTANTALRLEPAGTMFETAPGKEAFVNIYPLYEENTKHDVKVTGYALPGAQASDFLSKLLAVPAWASEANRSRGDLFAQAAKTQSFQVTAAVEQKDYSSFVRVPGVAAGVYLVRLDPVAPAGVTSEPSWFVLQSTEIATFDMSDAKNTVFWTMNVATGRPVSGATVRVEGTSYQTSEEGVAKFPTPAKVTDENPDAQQAIIAEVTSGSLTALVPIENVQRAMPFDFGYRQMPSARDTTWGYLFTDRPLYRLQDSISFFGMAQDRDTSRPASGITVELRRYGFIEFGSFQDKVYASAQVTPDADGSFHGSLDWDTLAPGYYSVVVNRDGKEIASRSIELRDFVKPIFNLELSTAKPAVYAGDTIEGQVKATLFDGSPAVGQEIRLNEYSENDSNETTVTTDESGMATFQFVTKHRTCDLAATYSYCGSQQSATIAASPVKGEEASIQSTAYVAVWTARVAVDMEQKPHGDSTDIIFHVHRVDLSKNDNSSVLAQPAAGVAITGKIMEQEWVKKEDGTTYDPIEKKSVPRYTYELKETQVATVNVTSGSDGNAKITQAVKKDRSYRVAVSMTDETGAVESLSTTFSNGWVDTGSGDSTVRLELDPAVTPDVTQQSFKRGEQIGLHFMKGQNAIPDADHTTFLYVEASRGIRNVVATNRSNYAFTYRDELIPNVTVYGISFGATGFTQTEFYTSFNNATQGLKVTVTPDATSYAPGAKVTASIDVRTQDGAPVSNAHVALAAVDESLFGAALYSVEEDPLNALYSGVSDGILLTRSSHDALSQKMVGGAEGGGGGGDTLATRRNFKDVADIETLTTDAGGRATVSFTAPDNITTWRLTSVALTGDRRAGTARGKAVVTKPVFVDAVIPETLLASDQPVLKLRAFGSGLKTGEAITMTVDAPTLGLHGETIQGVAGTPVYVAVPTLTTGNHTATIKITSGHGSDAIERHIVVVGSRFTHDEATVTELAPGVALPDTGEEAETDITFLPLGRSQYLGRVQSLANPWSARLEAKIAGNIARTLLRESFGKTDVEPAMPLLAYQQNSGGLSPLPYASEDVALSAKVAAVDATDIDRASLANYFWSITDDAKASREEGIQALLGLAALGEPVLPRVQQLADSADLSWRERLALIRALDAAGDRERARAMLDAVLKDAVTTDGLTHLPVADDKQSIIEATAEVSPLAAKMGMPQAAGLSAYLDANWDEAAMTDLDRAAYLAQVVPMLLPGDVTIKYAVNGKETSVTLKDGETQIVTLTKAEAQSFRVTSVDGPAAVSFTRRVGGRMPVSSDVSLSRSYALEDGGSLETLTEGKIVVVTLTPSMKSAAQDGCYVVRDRLPSGLLPYVYPVGVFYNASKVANDYPFEVNGSEVSFITCKGDSRPITYRMRVISRGTYTAEAASMQSMVAPSVAALSTDTTVTIK